MSAQKNAQPLTFVCPHCSGRSTIPPGPTQAEIKCPGCKRMLSLTGDARVSIAKTPEPAASHQPGSSELLPTNESIKWATGFVALYLLVMLLPRLWGVNVEYIILSSIAIGFCSVLVIHRDARRHGFQMEWEFPTLLFPIVFVPLYCINRASLIKNANAQPKTIRPVPVGFIVVSAICVMALIFAIIMEKHRDKLEGRMATPEGQVKAYLDACIRDDVMTSIYLNPGVDASLVRGHIVQGYKIKNVTGGSLTFPGDVVSATVIFKAKSGGDVTQTLKFTVRNKQIVKIE